MKLWVVSTLAAISLADAGIDGGSPPDEIRVVGKRPACVGVNAIAAVTMGGYNHVVTLSNKCKKSAVCTVYTDVAPERLATTLAAGESAELTTYRSSPARVFRATVECREL